MGALSINNNDAHVVSFERHAFLEKLAHQPIYNEVACQLSLYVPPSQNRWASALVTGHKGCGKTWLGRYRLLPSMLASKRLGFAFIHPSEKQAVIELCEHFSKTHFTAVKVEDILTTKITKPTKDEIKLYVCATNKLEQIQKAYKKINLRVWEKNIFKKALNIIDKDFFIYYDADDYLTKGELSKLLKITNHKVVILSEPLSQLTELLSDFEKVYEGSNFPELPQFKEHNYSFIDGKNCETTKLHFFKNNTLTYLEEKHGRDLINKILSDLSPSFISNSNSK